MAVNKEKRSAFQERATDEATESLRSGRDAVIISPTGSGKTIMGLEVVKQLQFDETDAPFRTLVVQDRVAIAAQNKQRADELMMEGNVLWTDGKNPGGGRTVFASIDTALKADSDLSGFRLLDIDECHHAGAAGPSRNGTEYTRLIDRMTAANPRLMIMGLSALEGRTDNQDLHPRLADAHRIKITHHEAMDAGAIVPVHTIVPEWRLDGKSNATVRDAIRPFFKTNDPTKRDAGIQSMLQRHRPKDFLDFVVDQTRKHIPDTPSFAYVSRTGEADELASIYRANGISAESIHYNQAGSHNRRAFERFAEGSLQVLTSVDMLTEGVDFTKVGAIINAKAITSYNDMMQMAGRAMRAHTEIAGGTVRDKTHAVNLDLGATTYAHGTPEMAMAIETLGHHGRAATGTRLWKEVSTEPSILALTRGTTTVFAVENNRAVTPAQQYALFVRDDIGGKSDKGGGSRTLRRAPTPWAGAKEMEAYERDQARSRPRMYALYESENRDTGRFGADPTNPLAEPDPGSTKLQQMGENSYKESKGSLDLMAKQVINSTQKRAEATQTKSTSTIMPTIPIRNLKKSRSDGMEID